MPEHNKSHQNSSLTMSNEKQEKEVVTDYWLLIIII